MSEPLSDPRSRDAHLWAEREAAKLSEIASAMERWSVQSLDQKRQYKQATGAL